MDEIQSGARSDIRCFRLDIINPGTRHLIPEPVEEATDTAGILSSSELYVLNALAVGATALSLAEREHRSVAPRR